VHQGLNKQIGVLIFSYKIYDRTGLGVNEILFPFKNTAQGFPSIRVTLDSDVETKSSRIASLKLILKEKEVHAFGSCGVK
jgi:hypothetical protein